MRVLVVDDEADVREMLRAVLAAEGFDVIAVPDGAGAIAAARTGQFDLVTVDLRMPGLSGRETLAELRRIAPALPAIVISGYVTPAEARACLALGTFAIVRNGMCNS